MSEKKRTDDGRCYHCGVPGGHARDVKCEICGKEMYYSGDKRHEPEVALCVADTTMVECKEIIFQYAHKKCVEKLLKRKVKYHDD